MSERATHQRFFVPEVIQTSGMDCGPAALKSVMEGLGIRVHYGRLREACQTDVDGTSIDTLEGIANDLGMNAEQIMLPADHVFLSSANVLPALAVVQLPNLGTHFIVLWRRHGSFIQIMDPASGRHWVPVNQILDQLYRHSMPVPLPAWREWAGSEDFTGPLSERMQAIGLALKTCQSRINAATSDPGWRGLASLDAAVRMIQSLVTAGGIKKGSEATKVLQAIWDQGKATIDTIPDSYWSVLEWESPDEEPLLLLRGAVTVRMRTQHKSPVENKLTEAVQGDPTSTSLAKVLDEPEPRPFSSLFQVVREEGLVTPLLICLAVFVAALGVLFEALLFRGLLDIGNEIGLTEQRIGAAAALLIFAIALLLVELPIMSAIFRYGRIIETRLRLALLQKIPLLHDRYFQSRLTSDMAERAHTLHTLGQMPLLSERILRLVFRLMFTTIGIIWLDPSAAALALISAVAAIAIPTLSLFLLQERDMQIRAHDGALSRFYLDALLGIVALRSHSAQQSVAREHESLLTEWMRAGLGLQRIVVMVEGFQMFIGFGLAAWLLARHFGQSTEMGAMLLLTYWALNLPGIGQQLAEAFRQVPEVKSRALRLLEPLSAPEESAANADAPEEQNACPGMDIVFSNIHVRASGNQILSDVNLHIKSGEHIAVIGPSGAGKSSLVGLLLGWHSAYAGEIRVDGKTWNTGTLARVRRESVWLDPTVQIWNRSLLENITYGTLEAHNTPLAECIDAADLNDVLLRLHKGMQSVLGEGGKTLSGGEGQRVRLARALINQSARLVIFDEPFRGLERPKRKQLLANARKLYRHATLLHVTHDVEDALTFDKVVVVESGQVVEVGDPKTLLENPDSRFSSQLSAERTLHEKRWRGDNWQRLYVLDGRVREGHIDE